MSNLNKQNAAGTDPAANPSHADLDEALHLLGQISVADDLRWLREMTRARLDLPGRLHGIAGGLRGYAPRLSDPTRAAWQKVTMLGEADLRTFLIVVSLLHQALSVRTIGARGQVEIKTIRKYYPEIDWQATGEAESTVFVLGEDGSLLLVPFDYAYVYVRRYAGQGNADRRGKKLLSEYADRGAWGGAVQVAMWRQRSIKG
ncbi:MAG: hypothetical protein ACYDBJ_18985 [Aggregatilineales bacterium]